MYSEAPRDDGVPQGMDGERERKKESRQQHVNTETDVLLLFLHSSLFLFLTNYPVLVVNLLWIEEQ